MNNRMTGKTTRLVNQAVETLFKHGEIVIPYLQSEVGASKGYYLDVRGSNLPEECYIVDLAAYTQGNTMQRYLAKNILRRLDTENAGQYELKRNSGHMLIIRLTDKRKKQIQEVQYGV